MAASDFTVGKRMRHTGFLSAKLLGEVSQKESCGRRTASWIEADGSDLCETSTSGRFGTFLVHAKSESPRDTA